MREHILKWLNDNDFTTPREVDGVTKFVDFLNGLFPNVDENVIERTVNQLTLVHDKLEAFSSGLAKALSN